MKLALVKREDGALELRVDALLFSRIYPVTQDEVRSLRDALNEALASPTPGFAVLEVGEGRIRSLVRKWSF